MSWTRNAAIAALVLAVAMPVAACGGGDDAESFKEDYNALSKNLQSINTELGNANPSSPTELADQLDKVADKADEASKKLADLNPPDDAQDELDNLVKQVDNGVDAIRNVADAARKNDLSALQQSITKLSSTGQDITDAENKLAKAVDG
jgi:hypothetical protein